MLAHCRRSKETLSSLNYLISSLLPGTEFEGWKIARLGQSFSCLLSFSGSQHKSFPI